MYTESRTNWWQRGLRCYAPEYDIPGTDTWPVSSLPPARVDPTVAQVHCSVQCAVCSWPCPTTAVRPRSHPARIQTKPQKLPVEDAPLPCRKKWLPERSPAPISLIPKPFFDRLLPSTTFPLQRPPTSSFKSSTTFLRPPGHILLTCPSP